MAYEVIATHKIKEWTYNQYTDSQGIVVTTPYTFWYELVIKQDKHANNTSDIRCEVWARLKSEPHTGDGEITFTLDTRYVINHDNTFYVSGRWDRNGHSIARSVSQATGLAGEEISALASSFDSTSTQISSGKNDSDYKDFKFYHDLNGNYTQATLGGVFLTIPLDAYGEADCEIEARNSLSTTRHRSTPSCEFWKSDGDEYRINPQPIDRAIIPKTATNFIDEYGASFTYEVVNGTSYVIDNNGEQTLVPDTVSIFQAGLSLDGTTMDVGYRNIPLDGSQYDFIFTEEERQTLRNKVQGSTSVPIYYITRTIRRINATETVSDIQSEEFISKTQRTLTIVGSEPILEPTVRDIREETLALTGDENKFIRYESTAEFAINATASKGATIVRQVAQCGSKTITDLPYGIFDDVESGNFTFTVVDSRNLASVTTVFKEFVEYIKPTCSQNVKIEMSDEVRARVVLTISGNCFNGSFGAVNNSLMLEVRYTQEDGTMGDWIRLSDTPTFNGNTYRLETEIDGFTYSRAYTFQCRATDKLNFVQSAQYTLRIKPVFDWGEEDFNFNVPVKMDGQTVLRHNLEANNTVLSASGGYIYLRPGGTNSTLGETIIYPNGDIKFGGGTEFSGTVNFDSFSIGGSQLADYIIETGEEAMGSNGTWHWCKWASGKAECWGCRNFGNMAVNTAWGNLYRSAIFTQDLPDNVFLTTPDVININIVNSNFGGWICKHENQAPSAITTGAFIFVRPASATVTPSYIGFHVIGLWKY